MTVNSSVNKTIVDGTGAQTVFSFNFIGVATAYIGVIATNSSGVETVVAQGSGTTQCQVVLNAPVEGALWGIGGSVTYNPSGTPIPAGSTLTIFRTLPLTQAISLQNLISISALGDGAETGLDILEMQIQQTSEGFERAIVAPVVDPPTINLIMPPAAQRANTGLAFDSLGNVIAGTTPATGLISTAMQPVVDAASLALGRTAFGLGNIATQNIGAGLQNDGAGNVRVNSAVTQVAINQAVDATFDLERFVATGPINFTFPRVNTLWNGFGFWVEAVSGDVTFVIDSHDQFSGNPSSGTSFTVPAGANVFVTTDGASVGKLYVEGMPWLVQNVRSCSGTYNISASDNAKILSHNSGAFGTFIFPAAATLRSDFRCLILNGETTAIGKGVGGTNFGSFTLYPTQSYTVANDQGVITVLDGGLKLYKVNSAQLYAHLSNGSDDPLVSDGLADSARAWKTQAKLKSALYSDFDHNGSQPTCKLTGNYFESIAFGGQPVGCGVFFWGGGTAGTYKINEVGNTCMLVQDGAICEIFNIDFEASGNPAVAIELHQTAIIDILAGCTFGNFAGGTHMGTDGAGWTLNIDANYTIQNGGNASVHISASGSGVVNVTGGLTFTINGGPAAIMTQWYQAGGGVLINMGGGVTYVGAPAAGTTQWAIGPGAWLSRGGATIPGSVAGSPVPGIAPAAATGWVS